MFHQLSEDEIFRIVDLMIAKVDDRLKDRDMGNRAVAAGEGAAVGPGLRPGARGQAAAPDDPAGDRGQPVRENPVRRAEGGPDRHRRRGGRHRAGGAVFSFRGEPKPDAVPGCPRRRLEIETRPACVPGQLRRDQRRYRGTAQRRVSAQPQQRDARGPVTITVAGPRLFLCGAGAKP